MPRTVLIFILCAATLFLVSQLIFMNTAANDCCLQYILDGKQINVDDIHLLSECEDICYIYITRNTPEIGFMKLENFTNNPQENVKSKFISSPTEIEVNKIKSYINILFDFCEYVKSKVYKKLRNTITSFEESPIEKWNLKSVSIFRRNSIVICDLEWTPQMTSGVYHVTWEIDGGGIKGHMFTDISRVKLSLWPETIYRITVRLLAAGRSKSDYLIVDTGQFRSSTGNNVILDKGINVVMIGKYSKLQIILFSALMIVLIVSFIVIKLTAQRENVKQYVLSHSYYDLHTVTEPLLGDDWKSGKMSNYLQLQTA